MKDKILFLDIDGVLNVIPQGFDEFGAIFHQHFVDNLKRIIDETGAKIVISSTWRYAGPDEMKLMWEMRDLPGEVIDVTPYFASEEIKELYAENTKQDCRGYEIQEWLDNHECESYVILDDDTDMLSRQMSNFVRTSENIDDYDCVDVGYGLIDRCTEKAIEILNK